MTTRLITKDSSVIQICKFGSKRAAQSDELANHHTSTKLKSPS